MVPLEGRGWPGLAGLGWAVGEAGRKKGGPKLGLGLWLGGLGGWAGGVLGRVSGLGGGWAGLGWAGLAWPGLAWPGLAWAGWALLRCGLWAGGWVGWAGWVSNPETETGLLEHESNLFENGKVCLRRKMSLRMVNSNKQYLFVSFLRV